MKELLQHALLIFSREFKTAFIGILLDMISQNYHRSYVDQCAFKFYSTFSIVKICRNKKVIHVSTVIKDFIHRVTFWFANFADLYLFTLCIAPLYKTYLAEKSHASVHKCYKLGTCEYQKYTFFNHMDLKIWNFWQAHAGVRWVQNLNESSTGT